MTSGYRVWEWVLSADRVGGVEKSGWGNDGMFIEANSHCRRHGTTDGALRKSEGHPHGR